MTESIKLATHFFLNAETLFESFMISSFKSFKTLVCAFKRQKRLETRY